LTFGRLSVVLKVTRRISVLLEQTNQ